MGEKNVKTNVSDFSRKNFLKCVLQNTGLISIPQN